jgi:hypothetical protein
VPGKPTAAKIGAAASLRALEPANRHDAQMSSTALDAIVPLASVLLGAAITYGLNVRTRRRTKLEDVLHDAIAAVSEAAASREFISGVGPWQGATDAEHAAFLSELGRESNREYVRAAARARVALARASAYKPDLRRFAMGDPTRLADQADDIIAELRRMLDDRR